MRKVVIIGLDGATWNLIEPWIKEGKLPTFKKLIREGVYGNLLSTIPSNSSPAWLSLVTGKNPGKLGVYDFFERKNNGYDFGFVNFKALIEKNQYFHEYMNKQGISTGLINVPLIPPHKINGFVVSDKFTSNKNDFTYPKNLKHELDKVVDTYEVGLKEGFHWDESIILKDVQRILDKRKKSMLYLFNTYECDFLMVVFTSPDRIQHFMWKYMDTLHPDYDDQKSMEYNKAIENIWINIDNILDDIMEKIDSDYNIFIVSDHGFGIQNKVFNVNDWLISNRYLDIKKRNPLINYMSKYIWHIYKKLLKMGIMKYFKYIIPKVIIDVTPKIYPSYEKIKKNINWKNTKAYSGPHAVGCENIYINLKGREKYGFVNKNNYDNLRIEIIQKLQKYMEENNLNITIYKREDIYKGPFIENAPDILYKINNYECISDTNFFHKNIIETRAINTKQNATHRQKGIFIAYGPDMQKGVKLLNDPDIYDIAPTIIHMFNLSIPNDMDGKFLKAIFKNESNIIKRQVKYHDVIESQKLKILKRIKKMRARPRNTNETNEFFLR